MDVQYAIAIVMIVGALLYAAVLLRQKARSFTTKPGCGKDCGCNGVAKKLTS